MAGCESPAQACLFRTTLGAQPFVIADLEIGEQPTQAVISISAAGNEDALRDSLARIFAAIMPTRPGILDLPDGRMLWMTPTQYMMCAPIEQEAALIAKIETGVDPNIVLVSAISGAWAWFRLQGRKARTLMSMACAIDFDAPARPPVMLVHTRLAGLRATVITEPGDRYTIGVDASLSGWLGARLQNMAGVI